MAVCMWNAIPNHIHIHYRNPVSKASAHLQSITFHYHHHCNYRNRNINKVPTYPHQPATMLLLSLWTLFGLGIVTTWRLSSSWSVICMVWSLIIGAFFIIFWPPHEMVCTSCLPSIPTVINRSLSELDANQRQTFHILSSEALHAHNALYYRLGRPTSIRTDKTRLSDM